MTNHGVVQANLLGRHLAGQGVRFTHVFSSDLRRARDTAEAICRAQLSPENNGESDSLAPLPLPELREQDFGPFEGKSFSTRPRTVSHNTRSWANDSLEVLRDGDGVETKESMRRRADTFIDNNMLPLLSNTATLDGGTVAVVAHGLILSTLWRCLLKRFSPSSVTVGPNAMAADRPLVLEHLGAWSNTGYLDLHLVSNELCNPRHDTVTVARLGDPGLVERPPGSSRTSATLTVTESTSATSAFHNLSMTIQVVNGQTHIRGLKRTRGGVGSASHDAGQRKIETFFKKQKNC